MEGVDRHRDCLTMEHVYGGYVVKVNQTKLTVLYCAVNRCQPKMYKPNTKIVSYMFHLKQPASRCNVTELICGGLGQICYVSNFSSSCFVGGA